MPVNMIRKIIDFTLTRKKLIFIYIPSLIIASLGVFVLVVYLQWLGDRDDALEKLSRYKRLIDRTEELREGYVYNYSDVDLTAKVVDIPTRIYDRNDEIIGEFFEEKREIVPYHYIPKWLVKAVIASEDRNFYNHRGISYKGIFRAILVNMAHFRVVQGGSTITQQLAKVLFTDMKRSLKRKIYEAFCASEIEEKYDKQDILSMYLNLIYFGKGAYGVESASKMYFGRSIRDCSLAECAMIVATISSPKAYSPLINLNNSVRKTRRILQSLVDAEFITEKTADKSFKQFLKRWEVETDKDGRYVSSNIGSFIYSSFRVNRAPFFNELIRRILVEKFGDEVVKKGGLSVYTTIDGPRQDIALEALRKGVARQQQYHIKRLNRIKDMALYRKESEKAENIQGALVTLDPYTGEILAYVGGSEFSINNQNDHVSQIVRQPGSSIKPLVYAAALQDRDITPSSVFINERTEFRGGYNPRNYDNTYTGEIIVREALRKSINVVAVKVLDKTGYGTLFTLFRKALNLSPAETGKRFGKTLSLALGTYELSPLENCTLHSVIVNGGEYIQPFGIRYVMDYNDTVVWDNGDETVREIEERRRDLGKIIDPVACSIVVSMLKGVFDEGGTAYYSVKNRGIDYEIAGKTGTSTRYNDAWFLGYTSRCVTAVWIGNKQGAISLGPGRSGGAVAAPVWGDYISSVYRNNPPAGFTVPDDGTSVETICLDSGEVAGRHGECPDTAEQVYYSGTEPGKYCHIHVNGRKDKNSEGTESE